tara:strand:+ start:1103 stop:1654 length:552 start_codon:yes stop_codon:yes gene_type:complete
MAFWSDGSISPKLSFRWELTLGSSTSPIASYTVRAFQKPSFTLAVSEYLNINDLAYKPGILTWAPIQVQLVDSEGTFENNTRILYDIMRRSGYVREPQGTQITSAIVKKQNSALIGAGSADYGGQIIFNQIDASGNPIESWTLWNPFISAIDFGQANYTVDELMTISVTLHYDLAEHRTLNIF